jgi:hypothetical protein
MKEQSQTVSSWLWNLGLPNWLWQVGTWDCMRGCSNKVPEGERWPRQHWRSRKWVECLGHPTGPSHPVPSSHAAAPSAPPLPDFVMIISCVFIVLTSKTSSAGALGHNLSILFQMSFWFFYWNGMHRYRSIPVFHSGSICICTKSLIKSLYICISEFFAFNKL